MLLKALEGVGGEGYQGSHPLPILLYNLKEHKRCIQMIVSLGMSNCTGGILASNSRLVSRYLYTPKWYPSPWPPYILVLLPDDFSLSM